MRNARIRLGDWVSIGRIGLSFLFVVLFRAHPGPLLTASLAIVVLAQLSDHLDGYLVRRLSAPSVTGWLFDSVADRAFYVAAILAFQREYALSEIIAWLFVMREIILYAIRVVVGEFEGDYRRYRTWALFHAAIIRVAILLGCVAPLGVLPGWAAGNMVAVLNGLVFVATASGYYFLTLLIRSPR
jgi:phosphatidylglycerophosphate synthase